MDTLINAVPVDTIIKAVPTDSFLNAVSAELSAAAEYATTPQGAILVAATVATTLVAQVAYEYAEPYLTDVRNYLADWLRPAAPAQTAPGTIAGPAPKAG